MPRVQDRSRYRPAIDPLDRRDLPAAGVTASLGAGVLSVVGSSPSAPIVIDVFASPSRRGLSGVVVVEGIGAYKASQAGTVVVSAAVGEAVVIHRGRRWNPLVHVQTRPDVQPAPPPAPPVATAPPPVTTPPPGTPSGSMAAAEQAIVDAVNAVRQLNGLNPLRVNARLVQAAQIHARDMAAMNQMAHTLPGTALPGLVDRANFVAYNYASMGENIAFNYPDTGSVMAAWMNSPGHRANILNPGYTEMGVGISYDAQGSPYDCQVFGSPA